MRKNRFVLLTITAFLLAVAFFVGRWDTEPEEEPLFWVCLPDSGEEISCWKHWEGEYYLFLPSGTELEELEIRTESDNEIAIDGKPLEGGRIPANLTYEQRYVVTIASGSTQKQSYITFFQAGALPVMYIDVASGNMDYIHAKKGNQETGNYRLYGENGEQLNNGQISAINGRGNTTWYSNKKSYSLEMSEQADLLGMGSAQKWILLSNSVDESGLRNKIAYDLAKEVGMAYTPEAQWVSLYLNGEYAGLYLLTERNEIHPNRVALGEESFLVSLEAESRLRSRKRQFFKTNAEQALRIHSNTLAEGEMERIWQQAENAILSPDGIDPETGASWEELIDVESWAQKYLIEEMFGNVDAGYLSQFFYYDKTQGKLCAGPIWDFDLSMGQIEQNGNQVLFLERRQVEDGITVEWFYALRQKEAFWSRVLELYEQVFRPAFFTLLEQKLDIYGEKIEQSICCDQFRWYSEASDPVEMRGSIREYLTERLALLDSIWLDKEPYCMVRIDSGTDDQFKYCVVKPGTCLNALPEVQLNKTGLFEGWYNERTGEPFDITQPIYEDTCISGKWKEKDQKWPVVSVTMVVFSGLLSGIVLADRSRRGVREHIWIGKKRKNIGMN